MFGFAYWLAFLVMLEPGNLLRASEAGTHLGMIHEALRMLGAALIGAMATPALLWWSERFPLTALRPWRNLLMQALGVVGLALGLSVLSCILAAWAFYRSWLPTAHELYWQVTDNGVLLAYALGAQVVAARLLGRRYPTDAGTPATHRPVTAGPLTHVTTKMRGRQILVAMNQVDWIETQGNYLALHTGQNTYLIRQTITAFEAQLDSRQFVRVHRRALVCIERIQDLKSLTNGDAELRLRSGQTVRVSRLYRKQLATRMELAKTSA
ncbi:LytTR family DNA-binding domain-containing protein [Dyella sp. C9]|uniref:LytTR family DNA-binding domain-containing protein n=1 Tax=Dyella sp. C9 TaxID=2202154 RepID=UPI001300B8F2|nr:LytTR family DNA-binding domain-containing protein [Dyella sp. C9]